MTNTFASELLRRFDPEKLFELGSWRSGSARARQKSDNRRDSAGVALRDHLLATG
jgi:hypothetical protein